MDDGLPATAYVGQGGVNVYYDSWANGAVEEEKEPPVSNQLTIKTHPNPFSKTTRIQYSLPSRGIVSVHAYNILGQRVATLFDGVQENGNHYLQWNGVGNNGSRLPEGIYFLRIKTQNADKRIKLTFIR
jgi:flagellar hook assembly protein FlgD